MTKTRFQSAIYPIKENERQLVTPTIDGMLNIKSYHFTYRLGMTPKMPTEDNRPLFNIELEKKITTQDDVLLVKLNVTYTYRLIIDDSLTPTVKEIYELVNQSLLDFYERFHQLVDKTMFWTHKVEVPELSFWETNIDKTIDFWEDSIRYMKVDNNGAPLETN